MTEVMVPDWPSSPARARHPQARRTTAAATARAGLRPPQRPRRILVQLLAQTPAHRRHRPNPPRRALPLRLLLLARSSASETTARTRMRPPHFRQRVTSSASCSPDRAPLRRRVHPPAPRCRLTAPLGPRTGRLVTLALPLAPKTVPKSPDRALPAAPRAASYFTLAPRWIRVIYEGGLVRLPT